MRQSRRVFTVQTFPRRVIGEGFPHTVPTREHRVPLCSAAETATRKPGCVPRMDLSRRSPVIRGGFPGSACGEGPREAGQAVSTLHQTAAAVDNRALCADTLPGRQESGSEPGGLRLSSFVTSPSLSGAKKAGGSPSLLSWDFTSHVTCLLSFPLGLRRPRFSIPEASPAPASTVKVHSRLGSPPPPAAALKINLFFCRTHPNDQRTVVVVEMDLVGNPTVS